MAITVIENFTSNKFYPSSNPINCTVNSNNSGKCNFRYICDVYVNGTKVFSDKLFPEPTTGYAFFQLSRVLQDYIQANVPKTTGTEIWNLSATSTAPSSAIRVYCKWGEEYDSTVDCSGTITQYTNLSTSNTFYVFQSAIDYEDFPSFDYTKYLFATASDTNRYFLTNSNKEVEVGYNDSYSLDFISTRTINASYSCVVKVYNLSGSLTTTKTYTKTLTTTYRYRLAIGPYDINYYENDVIISPQVSYYTVQINWAGTQISEMFTFKVKDPKTYRTRIGFIGLKGGIEHFTFYHRNKESYAIERKNFEKLLQSNYSGSWTYQVGDRTTTSYAINAKESHTVASYCTQEQSDWLYEMWLSPDVWTYLEPQLFSFRAIKDGLYVKYWVDGEHGLSVGDVVFSYGSHTDFSDAFTVTSVDGNIVSFGLLFSVYGATYQGVCGYIQKKEVWKKLPIVISDNTVERKQRTGRPIEYTLNYQMAYPKTTLR